MPGVRRGSTHKLTKEKESSVTSRKGKARERQLARDKYERQLSRRAASARRRRQVKAGVGILVVLLAGVTVAYFLGAFDSLLKNDADSKPKDESSTSASEKPSDEKSGKDEEDEKSSDKSSGEPSSSGDGK